jgi:hypothetical protein
MDRGLLRWIAIIAGLLLSGLWLFLVVAGLQVLDWIPPSAACAVAVGLALTAL